METRPSNFSVVSKGYCFLCLNKISPFVDISSSSVTSFQDISRYLKLDMGKVFIQGGPVPPHLLAKVQRARLKVELCEDCSSMTETISRQCRQLEKLKMEIETGLESIHGKIIEADNETGRTERFRKVLGSELTLGMGGGMEILEVLRMETKHKCFRKIKAASPRLQIQTLTTKEIRRRTFRIHKKDAGTTSKQMSDSDVTRDNIKIEDPAIVNWVDDDDDKHSDNSFADDLHHEVEESDSGSISAEGRRGDDHIVGRRTNNEATERRWIINSESGKYKCQLCSIEQASLGPFYHHYNKVHRKLRIKCKICGKEFTRHDNFKVHHESAHLGVRFQCKVCKKSFTRKGKLMAHQQKAGCASGK